MPEVAKAVSEVLISYSQKDIVYLNRLQRFLRLQERDNRLDVWSDQRMAITSDWQAEIRRTLESSRIAIILVSQEYLNSPFVANGDLLALLSSAREKNVYVLPVILSPCRFAQDSMLERLAFNDPQTPLIDLSEEEQDELWLHLSDMLTARLHDPKYQPVEAGARAKNTVPFPRNHYFVGRETLMTRLEEVMITSETAALTEPQILVGPEGVGKTQIALEFAYRHVDRFRYILWVDAGTDEELRTGFAGILRHVAPEQFVANDETANVLKAHRWLSENTRWLLILDNAPSPGTVARYFPARGKGQVLITSKQSEGGRTSALIPVPPLTNEESALLLLRRAHLLEEEESLEAAASELQENAYEVSKTLGGHPLALTQASSFVAENSLSLASYQTLYRSSGENLPHLEGSGISLAVLRTTRIAIEKATAAEPAVKDLLAYCTLLAPALIPEALFLKGGKVMGAALTRATADPIRFEAVIASLSAYGLVKRSRDGQAFIIPQAVRSLMESERDDARCRDMAEHLIEGIAWAYPGDIYKNWLACERLLPHWLICSQYIRQWNIETEQSALLLHQAGNYLNKRMLYDEAEPMYERALAIREKVLGPEHPTTATSMNNLATLYEWQGKLEEAEPLLVKALEIRQKVLGPDHPATATSLSNLATLYQHENRLDKAEPLVVQSLKIRERLLGPDHSDTAISLNDLALLYVKLERLEEAEPLFFRALDISEKALGAAHPSTATIRQNLKNLERERLGRKKIAVPIPEPVPTAPDKGNSGQGFSRFARWFQDNLLRAR